jgi:adenylate cyclase
VGAPDKLDEWPRSLHAKLVDKLVAAGASVVVFDINFAEDRLPTDDKAFADALARAGNVVLLEHLDPDAIAIENITGGSLPDDRKHGGLPIRVLRDHAIATAPFPLPVVPVRVSRAWSFSPTTDNSPTLPVVALQAFALTHSTDFLTLLEHVRPGAAQELTIGVEARNRENPLSDLILDVRRLFVADPRLATDMRSALDQRRELLIDAERRSSLLALISMYGNIDAPYLNFYGPPRTINTVPYQHALQTPLEQVSGLDIRGKVVFVGYSARTLAGQQDGYFSVFSQKSGVHLSGVEIAATAFSNLLDRSSLKPVDWSIRLLLIFLWGLVLTVAICFLSINYGIVLAVASGLAYFTFASHQFASSNSGRNLRRQPSAVRNGKNGKRTNP